MDQVAPEISRALPGRSGAAFETLPQGLPGVLAHWAATAPERRFLTFTDLDGSETAWTFAGFRDQARRLAGSLAGLGVGAGDRCVIHTGNTPGLLVGIFAALELGAVAVPTIAQYSEDELRFVVGDCEPSVVITTGELHGVAAPAATEAGCPLVVESPLEGQHGHDLGELIATGSPDPDVSGPADGGDTCMVLYTSGTTSRPKGVMLSHSGALFTARSYADHFRLQPRDRTLICLPLFHVNGLLLQWAPVLLSGGEAVVTPRFSASRYWDWVERHEITVTHLVAGPIRLLNRAEREPSLSPRPRLMSHGMPLTDADIETFESRFGIPLVMIWGSTETGCGGTIMPLDHARRPGHQNIGTEMPGWRVRIVDPETGAELGAGQPGELWVSSPGSMQGYLGLPEATAETLVDGWVRTGDIATRDADGYYHFLDRLKDMLKPSGENVAASEIERVILDHPGVAKCAVVGLPDEVRMELVVAVVVPHPDRPPTEAEIQDWCAQRLARFKVPSRVELRDSIPETSIGKARKAELKEALLASVGEER